jgi:predicted aconitase with swiveling domain
LLAKKTYFLVESFLVVSAAILLAEVSVAILLEESEDILAVESVFAESDFASEPEPLLQAAKAAIEHTNKNFFICD